MEAKEIFNNLNQDYKELRNIANLWAFEQIKDISDPIEANKKFKELFKAFLEANS